jgi:hypothetical protein
MRSRILEGCQRRVRFLALFRCLWTPSGHTRIGSLPAFCFA